MNANIGTVDKVARIVLGLALISVVFIGPKTPWGWLGAVLLGTALINWCPLYRLFGMSTRGGTSVNKA